MPVKADQPPILEAAKYSWRFMLATIGPTLPAFLIMAFVMGVAQAAMFSSMNGGALPLDLFGTVLAYAVSVSCAALVLRIALGGEIKGLAGLQFGLDEARLMSAQAMFVVLILFLGLILSFIGGVLLLIAMSTQVPDLTAVENDPVALQAVIEQYFATPGGAVTALVLIALTGLPLLYIAARLVTFPAATLQRKRIMIFETWSWTKGSVLSVMAAMLLTLAPLWVLNWVGMWVASAVTGLPMVFVGLSTGEIVLNPMMGFVHGFIAGIFNIPITIAAAGLSAFMYQGFEPDREEL